jgi:hypothetical protein
VAAGLVVSRGDGTRAELRAYMAHKCTRCGAPSDRWHCGDCARLASWERDQKRPGALPVVEMFAEFKPLSPAPAQRTLFEGPEESST